VDRFTKAIVAAFVGVFLAALLGACGDEHVCPQGSTSERGRCRFVSADGGSADAFTWPPADTAVDTGVPPVFRPDATAAPESGATDSGAGDGEGADALGSADGATGADAPAPADGGSDTAPAADAEAGADAS